MARSRNMITRTMVGTEVTCLALNTETAEPENLTYYVSGKFKDEAKLLRFIQRLYDNDVVKNVKIVSAVASNKILGMYEDDFVKHAMELDANRKVVVDTAE